MNLHDYLQTREMSASELARRIGALPVLISQWKSGERQVPAERCPDIERATGGKVRCEDLRSDVDWGVLRITENGPSENVPA